MNYIIFIKRSCLILLIIAAILIVGEITVRALGITDFPLYSQSSETGYFLNKDQSGKFLNKNDWYVNFNGLNNEQDYYYKKPYTLLVGDSIIYGGNPIDYEVRIGSIVQNMADQNVWVAATGGWRLQNELAYVLQRKDVLFNSDHLIIQYDNGDLDGLAQWSGELSFPTHKPVSALYYTTVRYLVPRIIGSIASNDLPPISNQYETKSSGIWKKQLNEIVLNYSGKILFVIYPDKEAAGKPKVWAAQSAYIKRYMARYPKVNILDVSKLKGWNRTMYRDGDHPNQKGRYLLARALSSWITKGADALNPMMR